MDIEGLLSSARRYPRRLVCLTEETTEILYRIGAGDRVIGVSGFTVRPPEARKKPRVSSFLDANFERILELRPDLVLGFSDLQAELASALPRRPRIFFEEWHEPLISGIRWCSELVEVVGGEDVCAETRVQQGASGRIFTPEEIARRNPDAVIASWCGRKAKPEKIRARPGWDRVRAVLDDQLYEIKSTYILQPGPAALTDGVNQLAQIVSAVARGEKLPPAREGDLRMATIAEVEW